MRKNKGDILVDFICVLLAVVLLGLVVGSAVGLKFAFGVFPFGPETQITVKVERVYVDAGNKASHYMIGTDQGVFEVDNNLWLWMWNADELYAKIEPGHTYRFTIKGHKVLNWWFQKYPGVISAKEL
jgi:hypothetical protein